MRVKLDHARAFTATSERNQVWPTGAVRYRPTYVGRAAAQDSAVHVVMVIMVAVATSIGKATAGCVSDTLSGPAKSQLRGPAMGDWHTSPAQPRPAGCSPLGCR